MIRTRAGLDWFRVGAWSLAILFCVYVWLAIGSWLAGLGDIPEMLQ